MNEHGGVSTSSLVITERRRQRTGGCVGIFFQLFDWNRRFAKKKLFSRKLLPPARARKESNKFGGEEKQPKLRLIADENRGGFPNAKRNGSAGVDSEQKHAVRSPGLVARLMGLESMPNLQQDKFKKSSLSKIESDCQRNFTSMDSDNRTADRSDYIGNGGIKNEVRPQKVQKTGLLERCPLTRFGTEVLQLKDVISRSRKKHHYKLPAPVNSPRKISGRNTSRLIGTATKILEPGPQARSRAKCALPYLPNPWLVSFNEHARESTSSISFPDPVEISSCHEATSEALNTQSSCKNCGKLLDVNSSSIAGENPSVLSKSKELHRILERSNRSSPIAAFEQTDVVFRQNQWHSRSQQCGPQGFPTSICHKNRTQRQNMDALRRNKVSTGSKLIGTNVISDTKHFVALNRGLNGRPQSRVPPKIDCSKARAQRKFGISTNNSVSPGRKRRSMNISTKSCDDFTFSLNKPRNFSSVVSARGDMGPKPHSMENAKFETRSVHFEESKSRAVSGNDGGSVSFRFNSPTKHRIVIPVEEKMGRDRNGFPFRGNPKTNLLSNGRVEFQKPRLLTGDTRGALLNEKLNELTVQVEEESSLDCTQPNRTSALVLQELISALTAESPVFNNDKNLGHDEKFLPGNHDHTMNYKELCSSQAKSKTAQASVPYTREGDHFSPGSVLEAPFSVDSCSSSLDDSSGYIPPGDWSYSCDEPQPLDLELDGLCPWISSGKDKTAGISVIDLLNHVSEVLSRLNLANIRLKGNKLNYANGVIVNAHLLLGNTVVCASDKFKIFPICHFLLCELQTLSNIMWTNFSNFLGFDDSREGLDGLVFDCLIEFLDLKCGAYSDVVHGARKNLSLCVNSDMLIHQVMKEVRRWMSLTGLMPDELIEMDMSCGSGKWTHFKAEVFKTGVEVDGNILQLLLDEIVVDLLESYQRT